MSADNHFLPRRGEASPDAGEDYLLAGIGVILLAGWLLVTGILEGVWRLVCALARLVYKGKSDEA